MRPLKFRLWNGTIMYHFALGDDVMITDKPVMQFTGLTDRHGKEIYEGDILTQEGEPNFIVQYSDGSFRGDDIDGWDVMSDHFPLDQSMTDTAEVIGNIYESDVDK